MRKSVEGNMLYGILEHMSDSDIKKAIKQYWQARKNLLEIGKRYPERIGGNDNIIGRIGEFIALRFLESIGQHPEKEWHSSNPGYDLHEGSILTQVKVITDENSNGKSMRLKKPWNQFVLIQLNEEHDAEKIGLLTEEEHKQAMRENTGWSDSPVVKLSMLGVKGLIGRYGKVYTKNEINI